MPEVVASLPSKATSFCDDVSCSSFMLSQHQRTRCSLPAVLESHVSPGEVTYVREVRMASN